MEHIRRDKIVNIPNCLTLIRIALLPVVVWRFRKGDSMGALIVYLLAMLTDAVDGFIARRYNQVTALGKLLDPLADKLSLVTLIALFVADGQIPLWLMGIILLKEVAMVVGGAVALKRGIVVYALPIGKITTVAFITSIVVRFLGWRMTADVLLGVSVVLSMVALVWYSLDLMKKLKANDVDSTK
ncbi:MAG: CDP-alcohol phosphatidyltransferase family protein [Candidatus Ventricola sp.]